MTKVTPFLMFNDQLEQAIELYTSIFPDSKVVDMQRGPNGVKMATFIVGGQRLHGYNGGPDFSFNWGVSLYVDCKDQAEVDMYWNKMLAAGGKPTMCGWITDPFGLSWQIIPKRLIELMNDEDAEKAEAVVNAMLKMVKIDVDGLEKAYREA